MLQLSLGAGGNWVKRMHVKTLSIGPGTGQALNIAVTSPSLFFNSVFPKLY